MFQWQKGTTLLFNFYLQDGVTNLDKRKQLQPVAAYTDLAYRHFWHKRLDVLWYYEYSPRNDPLAAIRRKKLKKLRPSKMLHEP